MGLRMGSRERFYLRLRVKHGVTSKVNSKSNTLVRALLVAALFAIPLHLHAKEETKLNLNLDSGFVFNTNPYSVPMHDVEGAGSFVYRMKPSFDFRGVGKIARIDINAKANGAAIFGSSQHTRFMLTDATFLVRSALIPEGFASINMEGKIATSRQVETLFLDSLTQLTADFRFGTKLRPVDSVTIDVNGEAKNQSYFDVDQPLFGKYNDDPAQLSHESYFAHINFTWAFLEGKKLFADAKYGTWRGKQESQGVSLNPLWLNAGVSWKVAPTLVSLLSVGYANSFIRLLQTNTLLDSGSLPILVATTLNWEPSTNSRFALRVERDLAPTSIFLESYANCVEMTLEHKSRSFALLLAPYVRFYEYGKPLAPDNSGRLAGNRRNDLVLGLKEEVSYAVEDWLSVGFSHQGIFRWSNAEDLQVFTSPGRLAGSSAHFETTMNRNEMLLFARLTY